jgi:hypothetical protein
MDNVLWWIGVLHLAAYTVVGTVYVATWLMWRAVRYLGLWKMVFQGLREKHLRERTPG